MATRVFKSARYCTAVVAATVGAGVSYANLASCFELVSTGTVFTALTEGAQCDTLCFPWNECGPKRVYRGVCVTVPKMTTCQKRGTAMKDQNGVWVCVNTYTNFSTATVNDAQPTETPCP